MSAGIREVLAGLVGTDAVSEAGDAGGRPLVVAPGDESQIAAVLERASEEGWRVLPVGRGVANPAYQGQPIEILLTTRRLNVIHHYEPADLTFTAGAGLPMEALSEATEPHRQWLPLDPPGGAEGTLGALVSTAVPGPLKQLYGTARDLVLGLTLVSGDGRVLRWGGRVVKNVAGFDVTRLATGSWGTLGVITSVSARLFPLPQVDRSLVFTGSSLDELTEAGMATARSPLPLAAIELLDREPRPGRAAEAMPTGAPEASDSGALLLRLLGTEAQVEETERRVRGDLASILGNPKAFGGEESRSLNRDHQAWGQDADLVIRLSLLPGALPASIEVARDHLGLDGTSPDGVSVVRATSHLGLGVLRIGVWGLDPQGPALADWASAIQDARTEIEGLGGSVRVSTLPRALSDQVDPWGAPGAEVVLARRLKSVFDPAGVLAPGGLGL